MPRGPADRAAVADTSHAPGNRRARADGAEDEGGGAAGLAGRDSRREVRPVEARDGRG